MKIWIRQFTLSLLIVFLWFNGVAQAGSKAFINKNNQNCGNYTFSFTQATQTVLDSSKTIFKIYKGNNSVDTVFFKGLRLINHRITGEGWYKIELQIFRLLPDSSQDAPYGIIIDSIWVKPPIKVNIDNSNGCLGEKLKIKASGKNGQPVWGPFYYYSFSLKTDSGFKIVRDWSRDSFMTAPQMKLNETKEFKVVIRDIDGCKDSANFNLYMNDSVGFDLLSKDDLLCIPNEKGWAKIINIKAKEPYQISWFNNKNETIGFSDSLGKLNAGNIKIQIRDSNNCSKTKTLIIKGIFMAGNPEICLVSVDSFGNKKTIYWNIPNQSQGLKYAVYKSQISGTPILLQKNITQNYFEDTLTTPEYFRETYFLTYTDTCANETELSAPFSTPYLNLGARGLGGVHLAWTHNFDGNSIKQQLIRWDKNNNQTVLGNISTTDREFNDTFAPAGILKYQLLIEHNLNCADTKKAFSQIRTIQILNSDEHIKKEQIQIYPNPTQENIRIINTDFTRYSLTNILGKCVKEGDNTHQEIELKDLTNGIYFLNLIDKKGNLINLTKVIKL
jgi:hypothetical protein